MVASKKIVTRAASLATVAIAEMLPDSPYLRIVRGI